MAEGTSQYVKNNFSAGEMTPLMSTRLDLDKYNQGVSVGENIILLPQGGFTMAWGTQYVAEVKDSTRKVRIEKFRFSTEQAYTLELGHGYIRFFRNHGQIGGVITGAANNGSGLIRITSTAHTLLTGDTIYISGVVGTTEANAYWTVTSITANTFDLQGSTFTNTYVSGGKWVVEVASPYLEADLFDLQIQQSADVVYIFHPGYWTRKLSRTSHTSWTMVKVDWIGGPFRKKDASITTTITPSGTTGSITLTASAALFTVDHVDALWELTHGTTVGYVKITAFTNSTTVTATVKKTLGATTATALWREGMWSAERGFARATAIHDERLLGGGSPDDPATFAGSVSGSYEDMTEGTKDDDSYVFQLGSGEVPSILWFASGDVLLIGTPSGVFKAFGGSNKGGITPTNVAVKLQTAVGAASVFPATVESNAFYLQNSRRKLRRLQYSLDSDKYVAEDATVLARHILKPSIVQMAYQAEPFDLLWCVRSDGELVIMTTLESEKVRGFTRMWTPAQTAGLKDVYESATVIPEPSGTYDEPWFVCRREVNGQQKRYIEYATVTDPEAPDLNSYVACGLTYTGPATAAVSGLSHLEGRTVVIVGDGKVYPSQVVASGSVTLNGSAASTIRVGLGYTATVDSLPPEANMPDGPSTGRRRKLARAKLKFLKTLGASFSGASAQPEELVFRTGNHPLDSAPPLFSGWKSVSNTGWDDDGIVRIQQTYPLPMTVLVLAGKLEVGDI